MARSRVLVIGLDGATLDLVRPWAAEGRLPHLARFFEHGAAGPLRSTLPATSPAAWSTFATGLNPGKHGILDFLQLAPDSYRARLVNASQRPAATFWELAGERGVRGGILNVPCTYPPRPFNGFLVSGLLTPGVGAQMVTPKSLLEDLREASPRYAIDIDVVKKRGEEARLAFLQRALSGARARLEAAVGLYRKHGPDLFCVVFTASDRVSHRFWHDMEAAAERPADDVTATAIPRVYQALDDAVGALLEEAGPESDVLVMSDHGTGLLRGGLNLRRALAKAGLLSEQPVGAWRRLRRAAVRTVIRAAPRTLKNRLRERFGWMARRAGSLLLCSGIDFARTRAYPAGRMAGLFVNLRGRQPRGIVEPGDDYEAVRDEAIACLGELRDPTTGRRVARAVHRREDVWVGPLVDQLPDLIMEQEDEVHEVTFEARADGAVFHDLAPPGGFGWRRSGGHRRDGLLLAMGPHIRHVELDGARIADVPATVLALLGCPVPEGFDGRVLAEMLTDDVPAPASMASSRQAAAAGEQLSEEDEAKVHERLEGLGYL
jgi:predicted AlkP superfamily phosphohydrolase/phosphomutase